MNWIIPFLSYWQIAEEVIPPSGVAAFGSEVGNTIGL
jgi:hypothetical protein